MLKVLRAVEAWMIESSKDQEDEDEDWENRCHTLYHALKETLDEFNRREG